MAKKMSNEVMWVTTTQIIDEIHNLRNEGYLRFSKDLKIYNEIAEKIMLNQNIWGILFHPFNTSFWGIVETVTTFIAIYGMLIVRDETKNGWGCIFAFSFIWNAF